MVDLPQHKLSVAFRRKPLRHQRHDRVLVDDVLAAIDDRHNGRWHRPVSSAVDGQRWLGVAGIGADDDGNAVADVGAVPFLLPLAGGDLRSHRGA